MPYRAPGAYARFVKTAGAVANPGGSRIMGLIGTGLNYYEVYNEAIQKSSDKPYDTLAYPNVFEILNVSTKPVVPGKTTPDNVVFKLKDSNGTGNFTISGSQNIVWDFKTGSEPTVSIIDTGSDGSTELKTKVTALVSGTNGFLVEDGEWLIEITYIDPTAGAYRIINNLTKEVVGEYGVSADKKFAIPGIELTVTSTFSAINVDSTDSKTAVGDYVIVKTTAGKTEQDAAVEAVQGVHLGADLLPYVTNLKVVSVDDTETANYVITVVSPDTSTGTFTITKVDNLGVQIGDPLLTSTIGNTDPYYEIPGISFNLISFPAGILAGDTVKINTTAREIPVDVVTGLQTVPAEGSVYYVSYKYRKADADYAPKLFFDYDDIVAEYGNYDVTASGVVINSLSLGAEIAFQNGVNTIICVQAKNETPTEMSVAIDMLKRNIPGLNNVNTLIPLVSDSVNSPVVGAYAAKHIDLMSSSEQGKERMVYLAATPGQKITKGPSATDKSIGMVEMARSYANERVIFVVPGELVKPIRDLRSGKINDRKLPGCYAAIAVAALGLVNDPAEPLTNKTITGFKEITSNFMESEKNLLASAGCLVLDQTGAVIRVRHGITTSNIDVNSAEITLIQIKDYVIDAVRSTTGQLYVGNKNRPSIIADVQFTVSSILNQFISQQVIIGYSGLSVKRSKDDPRQIDVKFEIEAVYPLNYISISFGFSAVS